MEARTAIPCSVLSAEFALFAIIENNLVRYNEGLLQNSILFFLLIQLPPHFLDMSQRGVRMPYRQVIIVAVHLYSFLGDKLGGVMSEMTGAEIMIETLAREKVEVVFGIPGVQIMGLLDTFCRMKKVEWITVRHEQTAAFMAYGYSRTTGRTGVAMVVPGPGALNAAAAVGTAYSASTPMLLLAGQIDTPNLGKNRGMLHEVTEQLDCFKPITKWNGRIMDVSEIPATVLSALNRSKTGRPRPVQIEIPYDLWSTKGEVQIADVAPEPVLAPDPAEIKKAVALLAEAERPVIWAGGGIITADASEDLRHLVERLNAPVVMTAEGKGAINADHPLCGGDAIPRLNQVLSEADTILCLGSRFLPMGSAQFKWPAGLKIIQIDIDEEEVGRNCTLDLGIVSDVRSAITALIEELPEKSRSLWKATEIEEIKTSFEARLKEAAPVQTGIVRDIRSELNEDAILVSGITNMGYWSRFVYPVYQPRTYLTSSYFVTLGFAFPTALGAKVGNPDRQVVVVSGDGGFLFAVGDLATAVKHKINVVTLVFNDGIYGATYRMQQRYYENRIFGTELVNPDFAALARSFGAVGIKLSDHRELKEALRSALTEDGPVVIEIPLEIEGMGQPWDIEYVRNALRMS
jgi:acetolactate synthase-1/2/3 large subunit